MTPRNTVLWTFGLFLFWLVLSGALDAAHLVMGLLSAVAVTAAVRPLLTQPPALGPGVEAPFTVMLGLRLVSFLLWLLGQIVLGSVQVARVVLHPRLPIDPRVVRIASKLPHPLARLTLANSITLTPGTVTLDADGDHFLVHALTAASARGLGSEDAEGDMARRVRGVFTPAGGAR